MDVDEMANLFDVLYNNITSNAAPGLNDYEVSVFLTRGQDEVLKNYFNAKSNKNNEGFDDSIKRQADFSNIVKTQFGTKGTSPDTIHLGRKNGDLTPFTFNIDPYFILEEWAEVTRDGKSIILEVMPISIWEYKRLRAKPYKRPLKNQAWRFLEMEEGTVNKKYNLICGPGDVVTKYEMRYLEKPTPIIVSDLPDGLTIDNKSTKSKCILDEIIHPDIVQRAVELAKASWQGGFDISTQVGQRIE